MTLLAAGPKVALMGPHSHPGNWQAANVRGGGGGGSSEVCKGVPRATVRTGDLVIAGMCHSPFQDH